MNEISFISICKHALAWKKKKVLRRGRKRHIYHQCHILFMACLDWWKGRRWGKRHPDPGPIWGKGDTYVMVLSREYWGKGYLSLETWLGYPYYPSPPPQSLPLERTWGQRPGVPFSSALIHPSRTWDRLTGQGNFPSLWKHYLPLPEGTSKGSDICDNIREFWQGFYNWCLFEIFLTFWSVQRKQQYLAEK